MSQLIESIYSGYKYVTDDLSVPQTRGWFLADPVTLSTIVASYLFFCIRCGPKFMQDRKPYELKNTLIVYNIIQIALSVYLTVGGTLASWQGNYDWSCQPIDYSPSGDRMNRMVWWYYFAKITELLDTVFFILRKKDNQVTFLHLYHHGTMPIFSYIGLRYFPNGHGIFLGLLNSFVHIVMYTYYLLAGLGPQYQKYLWWKKHVTVIQLIQFAIIFILNFPPIFTSCTYPKMLHVVMCVDSSLFMYMFGKFYIKSYSKKSMNDLNANGKGHTKVRKDS